MPPLPGAPQVSSIVLLVASLAARFVGAPGAAVAAPVEAVTVDDAVPLPPLLVAMTSNSYEVEAERPVTVKGDPLALVVAEVHEPAPVTW